jgi:hypothetical protein
MLTETLATLGITIPEFDQKIKEIPTKEIVNFCGIEVPIFGELLPTEVEIYKKIITMKKDLVERFGYVMGRSGCSISYTTSQFIESLKIGNIKKSKFEVKDIEWDEIGYSEILELAQSLGVEEFISTVEPDDSLQNIINNYFGEWIIAGINGNSGLEKANNVLKKIPVILESEAVYENINAEQLLAEANLTWANVDIIDDLQDPYFIYRVIILLRTNRGEFNPFLYELKEKREKLIALIEGDTSKIPTPITEPIHSNENVETDTEEGNEEENNENSEEQSSTPRTRKQKK